MQPRLRAVPAADRQLLRVALAEALAGGAPVLPVAAGAAQPHEVLPDSALPPGTAVVVRTSGSTGVPKHVALSSEALRASAEATHEAFAGPGQWLVNLPAHLISGLQMLVRSELAGIDPVFVEGPFDPLRLLDAAERMTHDTRYLSLVPVQLARLLDAAEHDHSGAEALRRFSAVLVGGQATPVALRQRAHDLGVALRRSYGMTETAGGCVYDGVGIGDTRVRVRDGEVQLSGSCLALGYAGDAELTAQRFIEADGTRWYRTCDTGELLGGMLSVTGRLDRVIVSGGVNVSLDEIERLVEAQPGWSGVVALGVPDEEWGERPVLVTADRAAAPADPAHRAHPAASAPSAAPASPSAAASGQEGDEATPDFAELRALIRTNLGPAAVPERLLRLTGRTELPRLAGGKLDYAAIRALIA